MHVFFGFNGFFLPTIENYQIKINGYNFHSVGFLLQVQPDVVEHTRELPSSSFSFPFVLQLI